jgi:hypothetical protein
MLHPTRPAPFSTLPVAVDQHPNLEALAFAVDRLSKQPGLGQNTMKPSLFLRLAAVISLLIAVGHTLGRPWTPRLDAQGAAVVDAMQSYHMNVMGSERTYFDFYLGFGWIVGVYLLAQTVLLWFLAGFGATEAARARPFVAVFFVANLLITGLDSRFLFAVPLIMSAVITLCLGWAWLAMRPGARHAAAAS